MDGRAKPGHDALGDRLPCFASRMDPNYLSWSAPLSSPALAQASSLSPPGEPDTPTAPMTSSPTLIGNPPAVALMPVSQSAAPGGLSFCRCPNSPEDVRKVRAVNALR